MSETFRFGNPWHGTYSAAGLTLDNGTLHTEWQPPTWPHYTYYVNFGLPAPAPETSLEAAAGMQWKNDVVLCGRDRQYGVSSSHQLGATSWLYRCVDGTLYAITVSCNPVSSGLAGVSITPRAAGYGVADGFSFTALDPSGNSNDWHYYLNAAPNGAKCLLNFARLTSASSGGVAYQYQTACRGIVEFTVTGGSVNAAPSVAYEYLYGYGGAALSASTSETVEYETTARYTSVLQGGYAVDGTRNILTLTQVVIDNQPPNTPLPYPYDYRNYNSGSRYWEIANSGVVEYETPHWFREETVDVPAPGSGASLISVVNEENAEWNNAGVQQRYLSNCLIAFTGYFDLQRKVIRCHSPLGAANAAALIDVLEDNLTVAALNPRDLSVAVGLKAGFI